MTEAEGVHAKTQRRKEEGRERVGWRGLWIVFCSGLLLSCFLAGWRESFSVELVTEKIGVVFVRAAGHFRRAGIYNQTGFWGMMGCGWEVVLLDRSPAGWRWAGLARFRSAMGIASHNCGPR